MGRWYVIQPIDSCVAQLQQCSYLFPLGNVSLYLLIRQSSVALISLFSWNSEMVTGAENVPRVTMVSDMSYVNRLALTNIES
jgi:hypothetical protein